MSNIYKKDLSDTRDELQSFDSLQSDSEQAHPDQSGMDFDSLKDDNQALQEKYGTPGQQAIAGAEAAGRGLVGPIAPMVERLAGVKPEDILARQEANPWTSGLSEAAGFVAPALLTGGTSAEARGAIEAIATAPSLISKAAKLTQVGALGALGEKFGIKGAETLAGKVGQSAARGAIDNMLLTGSDEVSKMILKDPNQTAETAISYIGLGGALGAALGIPLGVASHVLGGKIASDFKASIANHMENPEPVKAMTEELKALHDTSVDVTNELTGMAGPKAEELKKFMPKLDKAIEEYAPKVQELRKKFFTKIEDEYVIDPSKVDKYVNQVGKPNAEIKQQVLENFLDATDEYKKTIADIHSELGSDYTIPEPPSVVSRLTLGEKTAGSKLADVFISRGLSEGGGKALGAATGAALAGGLGLSHELGAVIGAYSLGPFFKSVLPGIAKFLVGGTGGGVAFRAASEFGASAAKGSDMLSKAAKNLFREGAKSLPESMYPTEKHREKLDKQLREIQTNPSKLMDRDDKLSHFMPDHADSVNQTLGNAVTYLNSVRPSQDKQAPLDSKPVLSSTEKAKYRNVLDIAESPMIVLDRVKNGTITANDIHVLSSLYPSLYKSMQSKILDELINHTSKNNPVAYKTRVGLSMFLAQPLDTTMKPTSIIAAQPKPQAPMPPQGAPKRGSKSSPALQKMPNQYKTQSQSLDTRHQRDK